MSSPISQPSAGQPCAAGFSVPYIDVEEKEELPPVKAGYRYLDFLGGTRQLRCYLVPNEVVRVEFMALIPHLDDCHEPVYRHGGITVRQDASYALPGFFVVSFETHYAALDLVDEADTAAAAVVTRAVRRGMRMELGIGHIHMMYEEKAEQSCQVHYWIVPVPSRPGDKSTALTRLNLKQYLGQFRFQEQRGTILDYNARLRHYLEAAGTAVRADAAAAAIRPSNAAF